MSPPRTKNAISAGRSLVDSIIEVDTGKPLLEPVGNIDCGVWFEMLIEVDTGFDAALEALFDTADDDDEFEFCGVETLAAELDILNEPELEPAETAGEEIVAGDEMPPAILPVVPGMELGS